MTPPIPMADTSQKPSQGADNGAKMLRDPVLTSRSRALQPDWMKQPKGYANGMAARGTMVFTAGVIGWDADEQFAAKDFIGQCRQALESTVAILAEADADPSHIVRQTWYITSRDEYLANTSELGRVWREVMGRNYPAMAVVIVAGLIELEAKVEIETTAVVPDSA